MSRRTSTHGRTPRVSCPPSEYIRCAQSLQAAFRLPSKSMIPGTGIAPRRCPDMRELGRVPPELMFACLAVAGFVVSVCYAVDWTVLF